MKKNNDYASPAKVAWYARNLLRKLNLAIIVLSLSVVQVIGATTASTSTKNSPEQSTSTTDQKQKSVSGKVTDSTGAPLPGVTIRVKGTTQGTITDVNGKYSFANIADNSTLLFSFVGMKSQEIPVAGKVEVNASLQDESESLSEVVVTGYGNFKKASFTGSANTVNAEKLKDVPVISMEQKLQGQTAGVFITAQSGQPGAVANIRIRGMGSYNATNEPLYVIDGVPVNSGTMNGSGAGYMTQAQTNIMSTINPNDIENITVIKDAAAASLYGSRAANGVILITTKRGKAGQAKVDFTISSGISNLAMDNRPVLSGEDRRTLIYEALYNQAIDKGNSNPDGWAASYIDTYAPKPSTGYVDWKDYLLRKHAYSQNYETSITGGDDKSKFLASFEYLKQDGIAINSDFDRYAGNLAYDRQVSKRLAFNGKITLSKVKQNLNEERGGCNPYLLTAGYITPSDVPYAADGSYNRSFVFSTTMENVLETMKTDINQTNVTRVMANGALTYDIMDGLKLKESMNYDFSSQKDVVYYSPYSYAGPKGAGDGNAQAGKGFTEWNGLFNSLSLSYIKTFKDKHNLDALVAYEAQDFKKDGIYYSGYNIATTALTDVGVTSTYSSKSSSPEEWRLISIVSRLNYDYDKKYYLGASFRRDGSSKFSSSQHWGNFWSVSGMWRVIQEPFMLGLKKVFTDMKIRASYGVNGNLPSGSYPWQGLYSYTLAYQGMSGSYESSLQNNNLKWEKNYNMNVGLDFTLFDRVSVTGEYYSRQTKDLLYSMPLSNSSGFLSYTTNIGHISNKGFELEFNSTNVKTKDFTWTTNLSFAHNKNVIKKFNDQVTSIIAANRTTMYIRKVGGPFYGFFLKEYAGVDPATGKALYYLNTKKPDGSLDKTTTTDDTKAQAIDLGKEAMPKLTSNLTNTLYYKNFDLMFTFTGSWGGYSFDQMAVTTENDGTNLKRNFPVYTMKRWQKAGDVTDVPRLSYNNRVGPPNTTRYLHSNDYIRLRNLSFGYTLPSNIVQKVNMSKVRFYLSGSNLWTKAAWGSYDPETEMGGFSWASAPLTKNITIGANISF
ncbi:MAG TPA: TonB-dependent receptor [Prolixibacteraceae bacterium]|nr:TonB-dependent receptor [Prolixibacteraceae bacterium]